MRRAKTVVGQREIWIEFARPLEVLDRCIAVFQRNGAENEAREEIAATQIFFIGRGVISVRLRHADLFCRREFETQALDYALRDRVLYGDDVCGGRVNPIAPQNVARKYIQ